MIYWPAIRQLSFRQHSRRSIALRLGSEKTCAADPCAINLLSTNPHSAGFTYVELMIVLTIICVLALIAIPNFLEAKTRAAIARSISELTTIKMAVESYRSDHRAYPPNRIPNNPDGADLLVLTTPMSYLTQLPKDFMTTREGRSSSSDLPAQPAYYSYLNGMQIAPEQGLRFLYLPPEASDGTMPAGGSPRKRDWIDSLGQRGMYVIKVDEKTSATVLVGSAATSETMFGGFVAGMIWGKGPGQTIPKDPCKEATLILSDGMAFGIAYDPSNGTISRGDIYMRLP